MEIHRLARSAFWLTVYRTSKRKAKNIIKNNYVFTQNKNCDF